MFAAGGITYTWPGSTGIPSAASVTFNAVDLERISVSRLTRFGSRCWTTRNAIPGSAGSGFNRRVIASSPPADAPMPTTGNLWDGSFCPFPSVVDAAVSGLVVDMSLVVPTASLIWNPYPCRRIHARDPPISEKLDSRGQSTSYKASAILNSLSGNQEKSKRADKLPLPYRAGPRVARARNPHVRLAPAGSWEARS